MKHLLLFLTYLAFSLNTQAKAQDSTKDWQQHYSEKLQRVKSEVKTKVNQKEKAKSEANKESASKLNDNISKLNEKFMYQSLNHFEFNKKKRKRYKVKNKNKPFDRFVLELLFDHLEATYYLHSGEKQEKNKRKQIKKDVLTKEDILFLQNKYKEYADSKFTDEKEHLENNYTVKVKENKSLYDFINLYNKPSDAGKIQDSIKNNIRSYHDYTLYLEGLDLAYNESIKYNEKFNDLEVSLIEKRKKTSTDYINQVVEQSVLSLKDAYVRENTQFLKSYIKDFQSMSKADTGLNKALKSIKISKKEVESLKKPHTLVFKGFFENYLKKAEGLRKKPQVNTKKIQKLFEYYL